jgi:hypothetical protein
MGIIMPGTAPLAILGSTLGLDLLVNRVSIRHYAALPVPSHWEH